MDIERIIRELIERHLYNSQVNVITKDNGFGIEVTCPGFVKLSRADREGLVYNAMQELPLFLVAKIVEIKTKVE